MDLALAGDAGEAPAEAPVMGVDQELLAGLRIAHDDEAEIGQIRFERIGQAHRQYLMAARQMGQRLLPAGPADEIGKQEDQRAAADDAHGVFEEFTQIGLRRARQLGLVFEQGEDVQHMAAPASGRNDSAGTAAVEDRAHPVAAPRQQPRHHRREFGQHVALLDLHRAEIDRGAEIEQEPGGDLAVLVVLAHMRHLQPRGDVPVDVAHVVVELVFAQIGQIEPEAAEQRAVVALQQAVETADHRPFQPLQQGLRMSAAIRTWVSSGASGAATWRMILAMMASAVTASDSAS